MTSYAMVGRLTTVDNPRDTTKQCSSCMREECRKKYCCSNEFWLKYQSADKPYVHHHLQGL